MKTFAISAARRADGLVCLTRFAGTCVEVVVLNESLSAAINRHFDHEHTTEFVASLWRSCEAVPALAAERTVTTVTIH